MEVYNKLKNLSTWNIGHVPWNKGTVGYKYKTIQKWNAKTRQCPRCSKELHYCNKYVYLKAKEKNLMCKSCIRKGIPKGPRSIETIKKIRLSVLNKIKNNKGQLFPNYNIKACTLIENYGKENNYNFQHALNGGEFYIKELGYWVDGYDKEKNVVIECDEPHHFDRITGVLKLKDKCAKQK